MYLNIILKSPEFVQFWPISPTLKPYLLSRQSTHATVWAADSPRHVFVLCSIQTSRVTKTHKTSNRMFFAAICLMFSVGHYSTQSSGSNPPATFFVTLLYSSMSLLYSLLYSETHYSTQKVAGVTENFQVEKNRKKKNLKNRLTNLAIFALPCRPLWNWLGQIQGDSECVRVSLVK